MGQRTRGRPCGRRSARRTPPDRRRIEPNAQRFAARLAVREHERIARARAKTRLGHSPAPERGRSGPGTAPRPRRRTAAECLVGDAEPLVPPRAGVRASERPRSGAFATAVGESAPRGRRKGPADARRRRLRIGNLGSGGKHVLGGVAGTNQCALGRSSKITSRPDLHHLSARSGSHEQARRGQGPVRKPPTVAPAIGRRASPDRAHHLHPPILPATPGHARRRCAADVAGANGGSGAEGEGRSGENRR